MWITKNRLEQIKKEAWDEGLNIGYRLGKQGIDESKLMLVEEAKKIVREK